MITRMILPVIAALSLFAAVTPVTTAQSADTKAGAQDTKTPKDVQIEADQLEVLDKESRAIFKGHVVAIRSGTTLKCDTLVVTYQQTEPAQQKQPAQGGQPAQETQPAQGSQPMQPAQESRPAQETQQTQPANGEKKTEVTFLDASGNTTIITSTQTITGEKAHMDVKANTMTVEGNVKVVQGKTIITGQKLFSDLNTSKSQMTGGRVKSSFVPGQTGQSGQ